MVGLAKARPKLAITQTNTYTHCFYNIEYVDVNSADDLNLGFSRFYFRGFLVITPCASSVLRLFL